jgi:hypothetical protein
MRQIERGSVAERRARFGAGIDQLRRAFGLKIFRI